MSCLTLERAFCLLSYEEVYLRRETRLGAVGAGERWLPANRAHVGGDGGSHGWHPRRRHMSQSLSRNALPSPWRRS